MYKLQRNRGTQGFGFYLPQQKKLAHNTEEKRILNLLEKQKYQGTEILFHHRFPTSTKNVQNACHPFSTKANKEIFDHNYVLVHNGIVSNADTLKAEHERGYGIKYISEQPDGSFNDSEALLYDVALYLEGMQSELKASGSIAFIVKTDEGKTFFARNYGSPLVYELNSRGLTIRSQGNGEQVEANKLYEFLEDERTFITSSLTISSGWGYSSNTNYDYGYHNIGQEGISSTPHHNWWDNGIDDDDDYGYASIDTESYNLAYDLALSLGGVSEAIDFIQKRFDDNEKLEDSLWAKFEGGDTSDEICSAIDDLQTEQLDNTKTLTALYEVYLDERKEISDATTKQATQLYLKGVRA